MKAMASERAVAASGCPGVTPKQLSGAIPERASLSTSPAAKRAGLKLLAQSYEYAAVLQRSGWDFAVEIGSLRCRRLNNNDFRWLVCKGFVEHAQEVSLADESGRRFLVEGELRFSTRSCFVLTRAGANFIQQVLRQGSEVAGDSSPNREASLNGANGSTYPAWHPQRRELRMGEKLVKRFRVPAAIQERILAAFEEEGWPVRIDDPLPPVRSLDPKRRLHAAIHSLNRNQKNPLIHFCGDGSGTGICWEAS